MKFKLDNHILYQPPADAHRDCIEVDKVKEFIKLLKEDCFICGQRIWKKYGRKISKSGLCDKCSNDMANHCYKHLRASMEKKIDKLAGKDLI